MSCCYEVVIGDSELVIRKSNGGPLLRITNHESRVPASAAN